MDTGDSEINLDDEPNGITPYSLTGQGVGTVTTGYHVSVSSQYNPIGNSYLSGTGQSGYTLATSGINVQWNVGSVGNTRVPTSLDPVKREVKGDISYRSLEREWEFHCPFGPACKDPEGRPRWFLDGFELNDHAIQLMQEILYDVKCAPLWINHPIFKYPAEWSLKNGPVSEYWDGTKYESSFIKKYSSFFFGLNTDWWKVTDPA